MPQQQQQQQQPESQGPQYNFAQDSSRPNAEEKQWMKEHFGGEFRFLRTYGLNIYKDEHREEGRAIAQTMMAYDREMEGSANSRADGS